MKNNDNNITMLIISVISTLLALGSMWVFFWFGTIVPDWAGFPNFMTGFALVTIFSIIAGASFACWIEKP